MEQTFRLFVAKSLASSKVFCRRGLFSESPHPYGGNMHTRLHEKLIVWQEAYFLCLWIYDLTSRLPSSERFRLVDQMCRSSYSIPTNIAEGNARRTPKDKRHYLDIASGSLEELHCQTKICHDLKYISEEDFEKTDDHINRVSFLLTRFRSSIGN